MNFWYSVGPIAAREIFGELALAELRQLALDQLQLLVAVARAARAWICLALRHLVDVLVVHRIAVLAAVGLDVGEQPAIDVEQLAVGQLRRSCG